jgi:hypothetical protein
VTSATPSIRRSAGMAVSTPWMAGHSPGLVAARWSCRYSSNPGVAEIGPSQGRPQHVVVGGSRDLVDVLAAGGAGAGEDELAHEVGVLGHEGLRNHAAQGEGENVDLGEVERLDEGVGVIGHGLDAAGNLTGGGTDAAVVEGDDVVVLGDGVDDAGVPVVQGRGEVDEEDDRDPALRSQLAVGVGNAAGVDRAGRRLRIRRDDGLVRGVGDAHKGSPCAVSWST